MEKESPSDTSPSRSGKPTLRTVAELSGFAVTTVSRALSGDSRIAETTRQKVAQAAAQVGYVPDRAAQRLRTGRTRVIAVLLNPAHEYLGFTNELLLGLSAALRGTSYAVSIIPDYVGDDRLATVRNVLRNRLADGVLFTRTETFDPRARLLLEHDFPFVSHGRTEFSLPHPYVDYDNEAFARMAVERLVALGRKRLTMIPPQPRFTFSQHLRYGFQSAAREACVEYEIVEEVNIDSTAAEIAEHVGHRAVSPEAPDGYVCVGEVAALATMAALSDAGRRLGAEVDVVAKRASPVFDLFRPRIETVYEDVRETGRTMGELLLKRLQGAPVDGLQVVQAPIGRFGPDTPASGGTPAGGGSVQAG